ncbi:prephenate dehydrogenase [Alkalibacterium olivapovliticus]|uniref:Prephenate dehydrogenase n=1 Tax=Alkalibacterium olivapovliticus TaxID=99907 RepID=A0A2T0W6J1_9LACT|nr:prephenate dehydrogenase [Alkalibacterium olivapovliticus]PRY82309.1 prephenate dehydrogenase [Alkalibacterium olivapovliticus]
MTLVIIGLGAIGGSFAMSLMKKGYDRIIGVDIDKQTIELALNKGFIHEGTTLPDEVLAEADMILLTLYPGQIASFVQEHRNHFKPGAVLTDVTGVKTAIISNVEQILPDHVDFIFAHPMRGSEKKGIAGADESKFIQANALITPISINKEENIKKVEQLYTDAGFDTVTRVTPEQHDEQIAYVSQLMHVLSVSVVNSTQASDDTLLFAGNSFKELTRIADINESLWGELFLYNKDALLSSIEAFEAELNTFKQALQDEDDVSLKTFLINARNQRRDWY